MVVRLHPEALAEYAEAVGFYEGQAAGLGREFFDEVQRVLEVIHTAVSASAQYVRCGESRRL